MERIMMKLEVYKQELSAQLNAAMAQKVRLEEQKDVNDTNIQRIIGALDGIQKAQGIVDEIHKIDENAIPVSLPAAATPLAKTSEAPPAPNQNSLS